ncbi:MAG: carbohydrate-binding domain-containing protein [Ruminococcus sp.]|nr:carbohydrate-binding domain-containing protein [Ruminococcus sp.]
MDTRRFMAMTAALTLMLTSYSCGKKDIDETAESTVSVTEESETTAKTEKTTTTSEESSEEATTTKKSSKKEKTTTTKSAKTTTTTAKGGTTTTTSAKSAAATTKSGGSSSGGSSSGGGNTSSGGGDYADTGAENVQTPVEAPTESEYTAEISLGSAPTFTGSNVTVDGSRVIISAGGDYIFSGNTDDGQIFVDTASEEKVKIILNGVGIANSSGPAIMINEAKKCTVELMDGTVSVLKDGAKDKVNDGVIFSNDTLRIKGGGELYIYSNNAHGIASDDDVIIEGGRYEINSIKSGIFAHDDITVNDGDLLIRGGTNGLKSKGTININGGRTVAYGGTKDEKSSVYSEGAFNYTGGYLFAAGNMVSVPTMSYNPYIVADLGGSRDAGTQVELVLNGTQMAVLEPHNNFRCVMMLAPEISAGGSFYTVVGGNSSEPVTLTDGQNYLSV